MSATGQQDTDVVLTTLCGNPRLTDGKADIGCYQVGFDPVMMLLVKSSAAR